MGEEKAEYDLWVTLEQILRGDTVTQQIALNVSDASTAASLSNGIEKQIFVIKLNPGIESGTRIEALACDPNGTVIIPEEKKVFIVKEKPHSQLKRIDNLHVEYTLLVSDETSKIGGEFEIPTLEHEPLYLNINGSIEDNSVERIVGKGFPLPDDNSIRGDLLVRFQIIKDIEPDTKSIRSDLNNLQANKHEIGLSLEEIYSGCVKTVEIVDNGTVKTIEVNVKPGSIVGTTIVQDGLSFVVSSIPHPFFQSIANDIEYTAKIFERDTFSESKLKIPTLNGETITLKTKPNVTANSVYKIPNAGLPFLDQPNKRGFMLVKFDIVANIPQDPPIMRDLFITLEQAFMGCSKKFKINKKIYKNGVEWFEDKKLSIDVKPGTEFGTKYIFAQEGDHKPNTLPADIIFTLREKAQNRFKRRGTNIVHEAQITHQQRANGEEIKLPTIDGNDITLCLAKLGDSLEYTFPNLGYYFPNNLQKRGDFIVRFCLTGDPVKEHSSGESTSLDYNKPANEIKMQVSLEEVFSGAKKKVEIQRNRIQPDGSVKETFKILTIQVKPGTLAGTKFCFQNEGDELQREIFADIVVVLADKPHRKFKRNGVNIEYTAHVDRANLPKEFIKVPTLEGDFVSLLFNEATQLDENYEIPDRGLPYPEDTDKRGSLIVSFKLIDNSLFHGSTLNSDTEDSD